MQPVWQADGGDPTAMLQLVSQRARMLTRSSGAAIALAHKGSMICRASVGNAPTLGSRVDISTGFSGECVRAGSVLRCDNVDTDPRVDAASCRRLNIHSMLAAPIRLGGEVVGLLEVYSAQRFAFQDSDAAIVEHLAETVFLAPSSSKTTPARTPDPQTPVPILSRAPKLLLQLEPAHCVFYGNLIDLLFPPQAAPLNLTSRPATFWPDVLVPSQVPWDRFGQSMLLHVMMVAALALVELGLSQRPMLRHSLLALNRSDIIYHLPRKYLRHGSREGGLSSRQAPRSAVDRQPVISVRRDSPRPTEASITPPKIELKHELRLLTIIAASDATVPAVPFSATTGNLRRTPGPTVGVVAPPPDVSGVSRTKDLALATPAVVEPAPSVHPSIRQTAEISLGHLEIVRPAPDVALPPLSSLSIRAQATQDRTATSVVPPPPSVRGVGNSRQRVSSMPAAGTQVVPPAPWLQRLTSYLTTLPQVRSVIVPPPPPVGGLGHSGGQNPSSSLATGAEVVPPAPQLQSGNSYTRRNAGGLASAAAVPPPPSIETLGHPGARSGTSLADTGAAVVPPAPQIQSGSGYARGNGGGLASAAAVPPPPSIETVGHPGARGGTSLADTGAAVVPPAPQLQGGSSYARGNGGGLATSAVPPAPSIQSLGQPGGRSMSSLRPSATPIAPPMAAPNAASTKSGGQPMLASGLPGGLLPGEITNSEEETSVDPNVVSNASELNVNFIGPALVLPGSSYFSNFEVFIAEERLTRHQSRLIKLVYDFLPYQPRLSDLGPNYPTIDNLRATRDPSCDEPLRQMVTPANTRGWPQAARLQLSAKSSQQRQSTLACYRTNADDYRRARARQR